jgi:hypothetical protein
MLVPTIDGTKGRQDRCSRRAGGSGILHIRFAHCGCASQMPESALLLGGRLFCVTTVSIVCTIKAPVPVRAEDGLDRRYLPWSLTRLTVLTVL